ncbi:MAG: flagellar biosynthesis protein FlhB [Candidatus Melainabacteria bacterium RIFOXYA12_FULL_32_12]|nr:MAG: flagellar biosynthesis protein FlhB [Candidatus Melainabacteria bacterium RIFOXYA2_FULL_32_9]OGI31537.1 MAG: flagellar biosynthesis protein FlhB [Candidatus Melainabacteria bacterium RIFOXYA12_FULL_32_12]
MAGERTEKATDKRRGKTRKEGNIPKSQDLNQAVTLAAGTYIIFLFAPSIMTKFIASAINTFSHLDPNLISREGLIGYFTPHIYLLFDILTPIMLLMMICGIAINFAQVGPYFSLEPLKPKFDKLNPAGMVQGFKKFFNLKSIVELVKSFIKMIIVAGIAYSVINSYQQEMLALLGADVQLSLSLIGTVIFDMITQITIVLIFLGILDKKYQAYEFEKSIKMTKEEIKDERKDADGNPEVKAKIRSIQMQFAMQRMMSAVPTADVVVTNPTHYAVVLRYDTQIAPTPQVVAKGVDFVAFKIKEIAKHNNIPIIENKPLARTLYKIVPLDGLIPAELYVAVAEVLAFVYKTNKNKGKIR